MKISFVSSHHRAANDSALFPSAGQTVPEERAWPIAFYGRLITPGAWKRYQSEGGRGQSAPVVLIAKENPGEGKVGLPRPLWYAVFKLAHAPGISGMIGHSISFGPAESQSGREVLRH